MNLIRVSGSFLFTSLIAVSFWGCNDERASTGPQSESPDETLAEHSSVTRDNHGESLAHSENGKLKDAMALWASGKQEEASQEFLLIRWDDVDVFAELSPLNMSDDRVESLTVDEKLRVQKEAIEIGRPILDLVRHALLVGDKKKNTGDIEGARAQYVAVRKIGQALSNSQQSNMVRLLIGRPTTALAESKIAALN